MTPFIAPECDRKGGTVKHLPYPLALVFVLIFVFVLTEPVVSLKGPEEDWQGTADKSGKSTHSFYASSSSSSSRNDLLDGVMARRSKQHVSSRHISHTFPTTYRPHTPPQPRRSNLKPSLPHSFLTSKKPHAPSHLTPIIKPDPFPKTTSHPRPPVAVLKPLVDLPTLGKHYSQKPLTTDANSRHLPPFPHSAQDEYETEQTEELDAGGDNDIKTNTTRGGITKNKSSRALRLRLRQVSPTLRVRLRPRQVRGDGTAEATKGTGRRVSRKLIRRKAAYPRRHLLDSRRSLTPGPPYDHYRRMVHVPLRTPTTLAPLPSMLHTLPQPPTLPTQPTHSKNSLRGRLYPKKTLPQSSPPFVPIFRKDKPPGSSHFLPPTPLPSPPPPPPPPRPRPRPYHLPSPRPHSPHSPFSSSPSPHPTFITTSIPSLPLSFPTVHPHTPSSPTPAVFHHRFHHTPPLRSMHSARPPAVFNLGRSSTPRPLVHPPPPPPLLPPPPPPPPPSKPKSSSPPPPTPPPAHSPFPTTTSPPSRISLEASREHRKSDYPTYASVPATSFTCRATPRPGIYVDVETGCQAWHVCEADGRQHSFLCPNGTIFSQLVLTCDWWYNVRCGSEGTNAIHTRPSREVSEIHTDPEEMYGRKIIQKPTKPYLPDLETFMIPAGGSPELLEPLVAIYQ